MTRRPLKVLFLTSSYPRNESDTASLFLRYLAEHLAGRGVQVHVLAPAESQGGVRVEGAVTVHRFQYFPAALQALAYGSGMLPNLKRSPWLWLQVPCYFLAMTWSLLRLLAAQRFDVIHAQWLLPQGLVGLVGARLFSVPLIVTAHGTDAFALRSGIATWLKRLVLNNSNAWTTNTPATAEFISRDSVSRDGRIIPMGVDVERFARGKPDSLRRELPEDEFLVLFVGRLIENKGCRDLLQAISLLSQGARLHTTLWVVGAGDQREELARAAQDLGIREKVRFFGSVSHQRLPDIYAAADIVVIPSKPGSSGEAEGQGVVALEAFAARACVLATRSGGIPSMVRDHSTGLLVEPGNPRALSGALERLLSEPDLRKRLTDNAAAEVRDRYSWAPIAGEFAKLYSEVSSSRRQ